MFTSFRISLYVLADYIYCNANRATRVTDFLLVASPRPTRCKVSEKQEKLRKEKIRKQKTYFPFLLFPLGMKQDQNYEWIFACRPFL